MKDTKGRANVKLRSGASQRHRAAKAAFGLAGALALACGVNVPFALSRGCEAVRVAVCGSQSLSAPDILATSGGAPSDTAGFVFDFFDACAQAPPYQQDALPDGFSELVNDPWGIGSESTVCCGNTAALFFDRPLETVKEELEAEMGKNGWAKVEQADSASCSTFVKDTGRYRWAYVVYSRMSSVTVATFSLQDPVEQ